MWMAACAYGTDTYIRDAGAVRPPNQTFFFLQGHSAGSPSLDRELEAEVGRELTDRGLVETGPEEANCVVVLHSATAAATSRRTLYQGWGGWQWNGPGAGDATDYKPGTLVVDVFDASTKKLMWHGVEPNATHNGSLQMTARSASRLLRSFPNAASANPWESTEADQTVEVRQAFRILFSPVPAVLVRIDGQPRYEQVDGTRVQRIANTAALIIRDEAGLHYLRMGDAWLEAYDLTGSWSPAWLLPDGADIALGQAVRADRTDLFRSTLLKEFIPAIIVSTTPADLVLTDGDPQFVAFNGTPLLYVRNTAAAVFREPTDREIYAHVSEGWFRAWTTNGPWEHVPDDSLPGDLAAVRTTVAGS
jgi:hypothetical protein